MFLVSRTLRPFRSRAFRPLPISQPWAYRAGKSFFRSEFSKAGLGRENTPHAKSSQVSPGKGEKVGEEDKASVHSQVKDPGDIYKVGIPLSSTTMIQMKLG